MGDFIFRLNLSFKLSLKPKGAMIEIRKLSSSDEQRLRFTLGHRVHAVVAVGRAGKWLCKNLGFFHLALAVRDCPKTPEAIATN